MPSPAVIGNTAECLAVQYLKRRGLCLVMTNYRCLFGELDAIMLDSATLVFIEVKSRKINRSFAGAFASITQIKQARMMKAAQHFLQRHKKWQHYYMRFDAVAVEYTTTLNTASIKWMQGIIG